MCTQLFCRQTWPQLNHWRYCLPSVTHARCHKHFIDWRWKCENLNTAFKLSGKWIVAGNSPLCQSCHTVPAERSDFSSAEEWRDVMWFDYLNNSGSVMALELSLWRESGKWPNWTPSGPSILFVSSVACFCIIVTTDHTAFIYSQWALGVCCVALTHKAPRNYLIYLSFCFLLFPLRHQKEHTGESKAHVKHSELADARQDISNILPARLVFHTRASPHSSATFFGR